MPFPDFKETDKLDIIAFWRIMSIGLRELALEFEAAGLGIRRHVTSKRAIAAAIGCPV